MDGNVKGKTNKTEWEITKNGSDLSLKTVTKLTSYEADVLLNEAIRRREIHDWHMEEALVGLI